VLHIVIYSELKRWHGGRERWLKYFLKGVYSKFDKICVYFLKKSVENRDECIDQDFSRCNNIKWYPVEASNYVSWIVRTFTEIISKIKQGDILVSVGSGPEAIVGMILRRLKRIRFVLWLRTILISELSRRKRRLFVLLAGFMERLALATADIIIANGRDTKDYYQNLTKKQINVIPNAIDNFFQLSKIAPPRFGKPIKIAFMGRFVEERGSNYFVELSRKLSNDSQFQFVVYGPSYGKERETYQNLVFKGHYFPEDLPLILPNVDIVAFLLPSKGIHGGGVSHALLEAMAAKRLIIAWQNPITSNLLNDKNAILVNEGNLDGIVSKLKEIGRCPEIFLEKCLEASKTAREFSVQNHVIKFIRIVREE